MPAKLHVTTIGLSLQIGSYGVASLLERVDPVTKQRKLIDTPVEIPDEVATQFEEEIAGERANPLFGQSVEEGEDPHPKTIKMGRPPRTDIKVVRESAAAGVPAAHGGRVRLHKGETVVPAGAPAVEKKES
jgi:hypothetical protein